jgi:hypothetical protein
MDFVWIATIQGGTAGFVEGPEVAQGFLRPGGKELKQDIESDQPVKAGPRQFLPRRGLQCSRFDDAHEAPRSIR